LIDLGGGDDKFIGGNGTDTVRDDLGNDSYKLGGGNDEFIDWDYGTFTLDGGAGTDLFNAVNAPEGIYINQSSVAVTLNGVTMQAQTAFSATTNKGGTATSFENIYGSDLAADVIVGDATANTLMGNGGDDFLMGGLGADTLTGGNGNDTFAYQSVLDSGLTRATQDVITDFERAGVAGGDVLDLSGIDAISTIVGNQAFQWLGMNVAFTNSVGDLRAFWQGNNTVVQGDVNGDGKADFSIALTGRLNLTAGDMVL